MKILLLIIALIFLNGCMNATLATRIPGFWIAGSDVALDAKVLLEENKKD